MLNPGQKFDLRFLVEALDPVYGFAMRVNYDPLVLNVSVDTGGNAKTTIGTFLKPPGFYEAKLSPAGTQGTVSIGLAKTGPVGGDSGTDVLMSLEMQVNPVTENKETWIEFDQENSQIYYFDTAGKQIFLSSLLEGLDVVKVEVLSEWRVRVWLEINPK